MVSSLASRNAVKNEEHQMKGYLWFICSPSSTKCVTCSHVDLEKWLTHSPILLMYLAVLWPNIE